MRIKYRTGREGSTPRLHQTIQISYGGDIGSTGWNRKVENCRMTPLLVKFVNANDNIAVDNVVYASFGSQKTTVSYENYALAA